MNAATRSIPVLVAAFAVVAALLGCTAASPSATDSPRPSATPTIEAPRPTAAVTVPMSSAGIEAQQPTPVAPVRIRIEALSIDMTVTPLGLAASGAMDLPVNPADAAWYRYGAWPGSGSGSIVIAAHVDALDYDIGPMARLPQATPGTEIIVTTATGEDVVYQVAEEGLLIKNDVPWASVFDRNGESRLTIVTCGGEFDYERRTYLSNVIVTALPVQ